MKNKTSNAVIQDYGYCQVVFDDSDKKIISDLTKALFAPDEFFKSDIVDYIKGDVTDDLHMTLFYGIKTEEVDLEEMASYLKEIRLKGVILGKIDFFTGYDNQYKIAYISVNDDGGKLSKLSASFKKFPFEKSVQFEAYRSHVTLAYLKNDFDVERFKKTKLSKINLPKLLSVKKLEFIPK